MTSSRTLRLLGLLQTHRYWTGSELADRLDVSIRTMRRDIDRLRELGYPVDASPGVDGGYQLRAGTAMPPLLLDDDEAVALAVALYSATAQPVSGIAESSVRAMAKLVQVMPPRLRGRVDALRAAVQTGDWPGGTSPTIDAETLTVLAVACRDHERVRFAYAAVDRSAVERHAEPARLVFLGRHWYLLGFDVDRDDWRSFRLDRLTDARSTRMTFRPRELPPPDAATFVRAGVEAVGYPLRAEAVVRASAGMVRERLGGYAEVHELSTDRTRIVVRADTYDWPALALGALGVEVEQVSPPAFARHLQDWAERFELAVARTAAGSSDPVGPA